MTPPPSPSQDHDDTYKYIYFDGLNLAVRSSLLAERSQRLPLSEAMHTLLKRAHADLADGEVREIALRSAADGWLVARSSRGERHDKQLYMLFESSRYASIAEVHTEVQTLAAAHRCPP